jgi:hypothetical protein
VFGEVGVPDACVREQRWTRIVVTLGTPSQALGPSSAVSQYAAPRNASGSAESKDNSRDRSGSLNDDDEDDDDEGEDGSLMRRAGRLARQRAGYGGGDGYGGMRHMTRGAPAPSGTNSRCLTTYVNARKCSCVSADVRGVLGVNDGRFAINLKGFNLFASSQAKYMPGMVPLITFKNSHFAA